LIIDEAWARRNHFDRTPFQWEIVALIKALNVVAIEMKR